jgi:prolipoprotein diacylglyceryltransferase
MEPILLFCLTGGTLLTALWLWLFRSRIGISGPAVLPVAIAHTGAGLLCVSAFAGLESFRLPLSGGMSLYGAVFLLPIFYWAAGKLFARDLNQVFDVMLLCMVSTLMLVRVNCIASGCCQGLLLPGSSGLHWPTREAEMLFHGILLVFFYRRLRRQELPGSCYPLYMMAYGLFRFIEEWFRVGERSILGLHPAHIWSILSIVIGWSIYSEFKTRSRYQRARAGKGRNSPC